jgi:hypothetical protein
MPDAQGSSGKSGPALIEPLRNHELLFFVNRNLMLLVTHFMILRFFIDDCYRVDNLYQ